jgi:hypothetical protein
MTCDHVGGVRLWNQTRNAEGYTWKTLGGKSVAWGDFSQQQEASIGNHGASRKFGHNRARIKRENQGLQK